MEPFPPFSHLFIPFLVTKLSLHKVGLSFFIRSWMLSPSIIMLVQYVFFIFKFDDWGTHKLVVIILPRYTDVHDVLRAYFYYFFCEFCQLSTVHCPPLSIKLLMGFSKGSLSYVNTVCYYFIHHLLFYLDQ